MIGLVQNTGLYGLNAGAIFAGLKPQCKSAGLPKADATSIYTAGPGSGRRVLIGVLIVPNNKPRLGGNRGLIASFAGGCRGQTRVRHENKPSTRLNATSTSSVSNMNICTGLYGFARIKNPGSRGSGGFWHIHPSEECAGVKSEIDRCLVSICREVGKTLTMLYLTGDNLF